MITDGVPERLVRFDLPTDRVMQSFAQDLTTKQWYVSRVESQVTDHDTRVFRCTAQGKVIDSALLVGGGHGSTTALVTNAQTGDISLLLWWRDDTTGSGYTSRCVAWGYRGDTSEGGLRFLRNDPAVTTMPDFWDDKYVCFAHDQTSHSLAVRVRDNAPATPQGYIELRSAGEYVLGTDNVLATSGNTDLNWSGVYQGHTTSATHFWRYEGNDGLGYPLRIRQFAWADPTTEAAVIDVTALGAGTVGGHNEAEGIFADTSENDRLVFGVVTGGYRQRVADAYTMVERTAPPGSGVTRQLLLDVQNITTEPATEAIVSLAYDRTVRLRSGGLVPKLKSTPTRIVDGSESVAVLASDDPDLTTDSRGFGILVTVEWSDWKGHHHCERYVAQVRADDPDQVALSQRIGAQPIPPPYGSLTEALAIAQRAEEAAQEAADALATIRDASGVIQAVNLETNPGMRRTDGLVEVERNLFPDPFFKYGTGGWVDDASNLFEVVDSPDGDGSKALKQTSNGSGGSPNYLPGVTLPAVGSTVTFSIEVWVPADLTAGVAIRISGTAVAAASFQPDMSKRDQWQTVTGQCLTTSTSGSIGPNLYTGNEPGEKVYWRNGEFYFGENVIDAFSGDTPGDDTFTYSWVGTPGASASLKTARKTANWYALGDDVLYQRGTKIAECRGRLFHNQTIDAKQGNLHAYRLKARTAGAAGDAQVSFSGRYYNGGGGRNGGAGPTTVTLPADGTWVDVVWSGMTPAVEEDINNFRPMTSGTPELDGGVLQITDALVMRISEPGQVPPDYFDGDTPDGDVMTYQWSGAADNSTSIKARRLLLPEE